MLKSKLVEFFQIQRTKQLVAADFHQNHLTNDDSTTFFAINLGRHQSECFSQKCKRGSLDSRKNRVLRNALLITQDNDIETLLSLYDKMNI